MFLNILDDLVDLFNKFNDMLEKNNAEPILWIIIFSVLLVIGLYGISKFGNK